MESDLNTSPYIESNIVWYLAFSIAHYWSVIFVIHCLKRCRLMGRLKVKLFQKPNVQSFIIQSLLFLNRFKHIRCIQLTLHHSGIQHKAYVFMELSTLFQHFNVVNIWCFGALIYSIYFFLLTMISYSEMGTFVLHISY